MLSAHVSASDLELFVIDGLDPLRAVAVEEHVSSCEACGAALAREASFEVALEAIACAPQPAVVERRVVARPAIISPRIVPRVEPLATRMTRAPRPTLPRPRISRIAFAAAGTVSLAAAWMLFLNAGLSRDVLTREPSTGAAHAIDVAAGPTTSEDAATARLDARPNDQLDGG